MTNVQLGVSITIVRQCQMTLLNWAYLPYSRKKKKQKKESVKASERGGGELANKDRFCTTIGKKKEQL